MAGSITPRPELGPLAWLAGVWEGDKGADRSPDASRVGIGSNAFRERMRFEPTGRVDNHAQQLQGLRYATTVWRIGEESPFHEEVGFWLWDAAERQVMRCFIVPRGIAVLAGGTVEPDARAFELRAEVGASVYGICSNPFLDREFRTVRFEMRFEQRDEHTIHYWEDTVMQVRGRDEPFHHTDENTLTRVA